VGALFRRFSNFLFFKKITLARWQLNTFSVIMLSLGFVLGTYAMITELIPRLMALDETSFVLGKEADTELTAGSGTGVVISTEEVTLGRDEQWFDLGWSHKKQLTVKNLSAETLSPGTPVQVTINTKELYDASKLQNDCDDLRLVHFAEETHTELTRSFHKASGTTNCSDSTATTVTFPITTELGTGATGDYWLYYNNPGASNPGFGDDGYNIGDAQATIVCPFNGSTTCVDGETPSTATGAIRYGTGSALSFDGKDDYVSPNYSGSLPQVTIEMWMKIKFNNGGGWGLSGRARHCNNMGSSVVNNGFGQGWGTLNFFVRNLNAGTNTCVGTNTQVALPSINQWHHIAGVFATTFSETIGGQWYTIGFRCASDL